MDTDYLKRFQGVDPYPNKIEVSEAQFEQILASIPASLRFSQNDGSKNLVGFNGIKIYVAESDA